MLSFGLLTESELERLRGWKYNIEDNSLISQYLLPSWQYLETLFPPFVSPNMISTVGFLLQVTAFHLVYNFYNIYPTYAIYAVIFLHLTYMFLDSIDGFHARKTGNSSPMGELIDHGLDSCGTLCQTLTFCYIFGITDHNVLWYITMSSLMIFQLCHVQAYSARVVQLGRYTGPCEIIVLYCIILLLKAMGVLSNAPFLYFLPYYRYAYHLIFCYMITRFILLKQQYTRNGLILTYIVFFVHSILPYNTTLLTVASSGLVMCAVTCDLIVSKMASKSLSQWIVPIAIMSLFHDILGVLMSVFFMVGCIVEISRYLELNIFQTNTICYVNGVFDMQHVGHIRMFLNAKQHGNILLAGVHNDQAVESYKRKPIMTHEERCQAVRDCRYVNRTIPDAPLTIDEDFIKAWNIHVVVCSSEYYNDPNDLWYAVPRRMGILRMAPYSSDISSSDLIKRCVARSSGAKITQT